MWRFCNILMFDTCRAGPYAEPWRNQDPDNHGTGVAFQILGFHGYFAGRTNLKAVKVQPLGAASVVSNLGFLDALIKIYKDILANHPKNPVIINISLCLFEIDPRRKRR